MARLLSINNDNKSRVKLLFHATIQNSTYL